MEKEHGRAFWLHGSFRKWIPDQARNDGDLGTGGGLWTLGPMRCMVTSPSLTAPQSTILKQ
jgi:hypothetical protein